MGHEHRRPGGAESARAAAQQRYPSATSPFLTLIQP